MKLQKLSNKSIIIAPSLLAADFTNLKSEVVNAEKGGAELLHLDVMDGHFVPNISFGVPVIKSIRNLSQIVFDAHLMITNPLKYVEDFAKAGADHITFHIESDDDPQKVIDRIKALNLSVGISVKPNTQIDKILPYLNQIDMVLVMTVEPGFGGQKFMIDMMPKVKEIKKEINKLNKNIHLQVDGGIDKDTIQTAFINGANNFVAGTSVFKYPEGIDSAIKKLKDEANK